MSNDDPVTLWIEELRNADQAAARNLWNHFVSRLYELGRKKLRPETRRVYDEEDAAQSAFHSVCAGIAAGLFPALGSRENLWHLLVVITARKVAHRHRHDQQQSRDVNRNLADSNLCEIPRLFSSRGSRVDHLSRTDSRICGRVCRDLRVFI